MAADRMAARADRDALAALRRAFQPGRIVKWKHGKHWRLGEVIEVLGFRYEHARVRVKSATTRKIMDVTASSIVEQL